MIIDYCSINRIYFVSKSETQWLVSTNQLTSKDSSHKLNIYNGQNIKASFYTINRKVRIKTVNGYFCSLLFKISKQYFFKEVE